ncbi:MAG: hypothetical protein AAF394_19295 [Planctomycetota bacterium]
MIDRNRRVKNTAFADALKRINRKHDEAERLKTESPATSVINRLKERMGGLDGIGDFVFDTLNDIKDVGKPADKIKAAEMLRKWSADYDTINQATAEIDEDDPDALEELASMAAIERAKTDGDFCVLLLMTCLNGMNREQRLFVRDAIDAHLSGQFMPEVESLFLESETDDGN